MSALVTPRAGSLKSAKRERRPLAGSVKAIKGGLACCDLTSGYYKPAVAETDLRIVGRFTETVDNTGANGAKSAEIDFFEERWLLLLNNDSGTPVTVADRESNCYALDDQTVTGDDDGNSVAGIVYDVTSEGVWVEVNQSPAGVGGGASIQKGTATLVAGVATVDTTITLGANSVILLTRNTAAGTMAAGGYDAPDADRVTGGPGTAEFVIRARDDAGSAETSDTSTIDWVVIA